MRFIGRREGVAPRAARADGLGGGDDRRQRRASRSSWPSTTAGARRSSTPRATLHGRRRGGVPRSYLYAPEMHDPDLIIRTSGEQRLSNYLLWQSAYSELHFTDVLWPDFSRADLEAALAELRRARAPLRGPLMASRPPAARRAPRRAAAPTWSARILVAIPAIAFAVVIICFGGAMFALGVARARPGLPARAVRDARAGAPGAAGGVRSACSGWWSPRALGDDSSVLLALVAFLPVLFLLTAGEPERERIIAQPGGDHARRLLDRPRRSPTRSLLRGLDHGGALVVMVLLGTFVGDTGAYLGGRAFGTPPARAARSRRTRRARAWSSGCVVGIARRSGTRAAPTTATGSPAPTACCSGVAVAIAAPLGDLFESLIKRDVGTKDTGAPVRRPRRRAGPPRRRAVRARRRLLRLAGAAEHETDDEEKRDRQMIELLNELRVALPGVQILFAFLLTVPFTQRFPQLTGVPARRLLRHAGRRHALRRVPDRADRRRTALRFHQSRAHVADRVREPAA